MLASSYIDYSAFIAYLQSNRGLDKRLLQTILIGPKILELELFGLDNVMEEV